MKDEQALSTGRKGWNEWKAEIAHTMVLRQERKTENKLGTKSESL